MSNLELNAGDNFIFGIDVSGSMESKDCPAGMSRIQFLKEKVQQFVQEASKYDSDGIDIVTFGHQVDSFIGITAEKAQELLANFKANQGATLTHMLINEAFRLHQVGKYAQTVLFIATDGDPTDKQAVKDAIIKITNAVKDEREFNIAFLTVGVISDSLRAFLDSLDDDLKGAKFDIVDVKALEAVDFMTAFVGALND